MKVLLINGSPNEKRCTYTALAETEQSLNDEGIDTEIAWIGKDRIRGCTSCGVCNLKNNQRCVYDDDVVNSLIEKTEDIDGLIVGSPVYYAGANGALISVLDRMFYSANSLLAFKPAAGISSARRAGTTLTIDQINKYFQINQMPVVASNYWPMVHGQSENQVMRDDEGLQIMRVLGKNMAWLLQCIKAGKAAGIDIPNTEAKIATNFIR